jgi:hypothetical protein
VVLGVESSLSGIGDQKELINILSVGEVLVEVVLEVLNEGHVLLNEVVSSNSLELESLIEELVGVDSDLWVGASFLELGIDGHGVVVVGLIKVSTELLKLEIELLLGVWDWGSASFEEDFVVDNLVSSGGGNLVLELNGLYGSNGQKGNNGESHRSKKTQSQTKDIALYLQIIILFFYIN